MRAVEPTVETAPALRDRYVAEGLWGRPQHVGAIESWAARDPDRVAVVDPHGRFTYAELDASVRRAKTWLESCGVVAGEPVVAVLANWFESVALYHAVLRLGAVAVPLSTHAQAAEIDHAVVVTGARVVVVPPSHADAMERHRRGAVLTAVADPVPTTEIRPPAESAGSVIEPAAVAVVLFTSGSTATPKGVIHSHDTLAVANRNLTWCLGLGEEDVHYVAAPLAHIGGLMHALHMPYENGARVVLDDRWAPDRAAARIAAEGVTFLGGAPVFPQGLVATTPVGAGSPLRVVCTGGAWIPDDLADSVRNVLGARFTRSYGSTECPFAAGSLPADPDERCNADDGALMPGVEACIEGGTSEGELLVRAASLFLGYVDDAHNAGTWRDGWFVTGDAVTLDGEQRVKVVGRLKAVAIRNGENISLDEVERALDGWHAAAELATFTLPDEQTGERVAVAVVPAAGMDAAPSYEEMVEHLDRLHIARQKYPEQVVGWDALPRTPSGKVDRRALAAGAGSRPGERAPRITR